MCYYINNKKGANSNDGAYKKRDLQASLQKEVIKEVARERDHTEAEREAIQESDTIQKK